MSKQLNVEVKVKCEEKDCERIVTYLKQSANFEEIGLDNQKDTYFNTINQTRLKVRQGNVENAIVSYSRPDVLGSKDSSLYVRKFSSTSEAEDFIKLLEHSYGKMVVVNKIRRIFWDEKNKVKVHVDEVSPLGYFIEIEVMDFDGNRDKRKMQAICSNYLMSFGLSTENSVAESYSDLILKGS